jgi:hypothetical protein
MTREDLIEAVVEAYTSAVRHFSTGEQRRAVKKAMKHRGKVTSVTPKRAVFQRWPEHKGREHEVATAVSAHLTKEANRPSLTGRETRFNVMNDPKGTTWKKHVSAHGLDPKKGSKLILKRRLFAKARKLKEPMKVKSYK